MPTLDAPRTLQSSQRIWEQEIVPALYEYIRIPNKSPAYEARWQQNMERAVSLIEGWCRKQPVEGLAVGGVRLGGRTPGGPMESPRPGSEKGVRSGALDTEPARTGGGPGGWPRAPPLEG